MDKKEKFKLIQHALEDAMPYPPEAMDLLFRPMFGGVGAYVRGRFFAIIASSGLALKLPADIQEDPVKEKLQMFEKF